MTNLYMLHVVNGSISIPLRPHDENNYITISEKVKTFRLYVYIYLLYDAIFN